MNLCFRRAFDRYFRSTEWFDMSCPRVLNSLSPFGWVSTSSICSLEFKALEFGDVQLTHLNGTLPETNRSHLTKCHPKRKRVTSLPNHRFSKREIPRTLKTDSWSRGSKYGYMMGPYILGGSRGPKNSHIFRVAGEDTATYQLHPATP